MIQFIVSFICVGAIATAGLFSLPDLKDILHKEGEPQKTFLNTQKPLKLLVWNILKHKRSGIIRDLNQLKTESDLALIQESRVDNIMSEFFDQADGFEWYSAISFYQQDGVGTGVATGSKYESIDVGFLRSPGREPIVKTPKMTILNEYSLQNSKQTLLVANIHALNAVKTSIFKAQIKELAKELSKHSGPIILAGDFNTWIGARSSYLNKIAQKLNLTWVNFKQDSRKLKLDHILTRGFDYKNAKIHYEFNSSDHKPLTVELDFQQ